jgi:hypothetical protein
MTHEDKLPYILIDCQVYDDVDTEGNLWWMNDFDKMQGQNTDDCDGLAMSLKTLWLLMRPH